MNISTGSSTASYVIILDDDDAKEPQTHTVQEDKPKEPMLDPLSPEASIVVIVVFVIVIFTVLLSPIFLND